MVLSPDENAALRDIERRLLAVDQPACRRPSMLAWALVSGAVMLLAVGVLAGNMAAVVLGVTWFIAAAAVRWVRRHLMVVATSGRGERAAAAEGARRGHG